MPAAIALANRTGGKTLDVAVLNVLDAVGKDHCGIVTVAGSLLQAKRGYTYTKDCLEESYRHMLDGEPTQSETKLTNSSRIEVLAASEKAVHSPHVPKVRLDEIDLMKHEVYTGALSIAMSTDSIAAQTIRTSTRFKCYGRMHSEWEDAPMKNIARYAWCVWEVAERCERECKNCQIADYCEGKAKHSTGYYRIDDILQKFCELDDETIRTQWLCEKPSREGLVYKEFDELVHVYEGNAPEGTEYGCVDWGYSNPFVYLKLIVTASDDVFVTEEHYITQTEASTIAQRLRETVHPEEVYCDPSGATEIAEFQKAGLPAVGRYSEDAELYKIENGLPIVRKWLQTKKLHIHNSCVNLISDLNTYHYGEGTDKPVKDDGDHGPDGLRYFFIARFPTMAQAYEIQYEPEPDEYEMEGAF